MELILRMNRLWMRHKNKKEKIKGKENGIDFTDEPVMDEA